MKKKISVTLEEETILELIANIRKKGYSSKSEAIEAVLRKTLDSLENEAQA